MLSLPLLIRILPTSPLQEEAVICCRLLHIFQMVVSGGAQEVGDRNVRLQLGASVQCFQRQRIVIVLAGGKCEIAVRRSEARS